MPPKFYQVGGSVRDELLGIKSKDIDYAVETDSFENMKQAILDRNGEIFLETPQYLTIRAKVPNLGACDFVLCRKDGSYGDGRHPEKVTVGSIYDDLARRDFTINAIAKDENGNLIDPHGGKFHLERRLIKCVGDAQDRFTEDGLRMLRALRFSITKNLILDTDIIACLKAPEFFVPRLKGVSAERLREELHKCFTVNTLDTILLLNDFDFFRDIILTDFGIWLKPTMEQR